MPVWEQVINPLMMVIKWRDKMARINSLIRSRLKNNFTYISKLNIKNPKSTIWQIYCICMTICCTLFLLIKLSLFLIASTIYRVIYLVELYIWKYYSPRTYLESYLFIYCMLICMWYGVKWISVMQIFVTCQQNTEKGEVWCDIISVAYNGSANGLSPSGTKPSPALILIYCQ